MYVNKVNNNLNDGDGGGQDAEQNRRNQANDKYPVITTADAVVEPETVMIERLQYGVDLHFFISLV